MKLIKKINLFVDTLENHFKAPDTFNINNIFIYETIYNQKNTNKHQKLSFSCRVKYSTSFTNFQTDEPIEPKQLRIEKLQWKGANLILTHTKRMRMAWILPKQLEASDPHNAPSTRKKSDITKIFRPISFLNTMFKILDRLLLNWLNIYIFPSIRPEQYGLRL